MEDTKVDAQVGDTGKRCRTCGEVKPVSEYSWSKSSKNGKKYYNLDCKPCDNAKQRARRAARGTEQRGLTPNYPAPTAGYHDKLYCTQCGKVKPVSEFYPKTAYYGPFKGQKVPRSPCKDCNKLSTFIYQQKRLANAKLMERSTVTRNMTQLEEGMRHIEFPPGTRQGTKDKVGLVAWATNRRGRNPWRSNNVTTEIAEYISNQGGTVHPTDIAYALAWLTENNYADRDTQGQRTKLFQFKPDVSLQGFIPDFLEERLNQKMNGSTDLPSVAPPTPDQFERKPLYRGEELVTALEDWAQDNPEQYATWVDNVIVWLKRDVSVGS